MSEQENAQLEAPEVEITLPFEIPLSAPIHIHNVNGAVVKTIDKITFQNPVNAGMLEDFPIGEKIVLKMGNMYPIVSQMTGETLATIKKLSFRDIKECLKIANHFLADGQMTGDSDL